MVNEATQDTSSERTVQAEYWKEHSISPTVEAMMLDSQAKLIDKQERPEVVTHHFDNSIRQNQ
jgi:hypothetical protein